jgi:flagellar motor switch protein FliM
MTAFFSRISAKLTSCWKNVLETTPKLREIITNPAMILTSYQDEMSCLVTHEIKIGDVEGMMNICYPESSMYDVMDKLKYEVFYQEPKEVTNFFDVTKMPARVSMAVFKDVTVQDIIRLKKGDVLRFNGKLGLFVNGKRKFDCTLGKVGNNKAAKIEINRKEFEEMK